MCIRDSVWTDRRRKTHSEDAEGEVHELQDALQQSLPRCPSHLRRYPKYLLVCWIESQKKTMKAGERPFGVGLLIVGCDDQGPHLYLTSPNAEYYEYYVCFPSL
eukprot:TRINITY_DN5067_c0_g1_i6.p3 TRINITY_DN5067_c0_g1~~TRINITY_DN5067_c0_g1_i6.p3  ORF type:complete len:104 (+),score=0.94 TRINITY_DN5067_c0_g1_i6:80-391(+)